MPMSPSRRLILWLLVLVPPVLAQDIPFTLKVEVDLVSVDVMVADANGVLINNLQQSDFEIYEEGVKRDIEFFAPVSAPYNIFLLFDGSSSTSDRTRFMQDAIYSFISELRPQDRVAVATFARGYDVHLPWSLDRTEAFMSLNEIAARGDSNGTRLYSALERTLRREFGDVSGRRAVIVMTDGQDTDYSHKSQGDLRKALNATRDSRIPVYFVALGAPVVSKTPEQLRDYMLEVRTYMHLMADRSGGRVLFPRSLDDLVPMYTQIAQALGTSYSLGFLPSASARPGSFQRIVVKAAPAGVRITQSRDGYTAR